MQTETNVNQPSGFWAKVLNGAHSHNWKPVEIPKRIKLGLFLEKPL